MFEVDFNTNQVECILAGFGKDYVDDGEAISTRETDGQRPGTQDPIIYLGGYQHFQNHGIKYVIELTKCEVKIPILKLKDQNICRQKWSLMICLCFQHQSPDDVR